MLMITRILKQPVFDGAMPYISRGGVEGEEEADPEEQLKSSFPCNIWGCQNQEFQKTLLASLWKKSSSSPPQPKNLNIAMRKILLTNYSVC